MDNSEILKILVWIFVGFLAGYSFKTCGIDHDEGGLTYPGDEDSKLKSSS